ncbi:MAG TPA: TetR/AcrR family transcriptional regulator [Streptosporangiaceae bacterium]
MPRRQPVPRVVAHADTSGRSTKWRIEQAALQLFAARGFEATGIRDIAEAAGVSTAALYHYMGSKDELLIDFMLVSMMQLTQVARATLAEASEPASELAALVRAHVGFHTLDPQRSLVADDELRALSDESFARVTQLRDGYERLWAQTLDQGLRSGVFRFSDARITRLAMLEMCNGVARWYSDRGPMRPAEIADAFTDLALAMVGACRDGRPLRLDDLHCMLTSDVLAIIERELRNGGGIVTRQAASAGVA